jgi:hypothetical protein
VAARIRRYASRLRPDGRADRRYGNGGAVSIEVGDGYAYGAALTPAGLVIAGRVRPELGAWEESDFALVRFDPHGVPDASFGDGGIVTTDFGS